MATSNIAFPVNLRRNNNSHSRAYGKYYCESDHREPLNLKGFARHISDHGKLVTYDLAVLVLGNIVTCLKELMLSGQPVKLDGLGTFRPTLETDGTKAVDTVDGSLDVGVDELVTGVHLRFIPENSKGEKLTSRSLKRECVMQFAYVIEAKKKTLDGRRCTYQEKIPIGSYDTATADDGGDDGD